MSFAMSFAGELGTPTSLILLLGVSAACRESVRVLTFRTSFMTQPPGRHTYCQSRAHYSWIIFRKISPYNLLRRPVPGIPHHYKSCVEKSIEFTPQVRKHPEFAKSPMETISTHIQNSILLEHQKRENEDMD